MSAGILPGGTRRGGSSASGPVHVEVTPPAEQRFPSPRARSPQVPSGAAAPPWIVDNIARLCDMNLLLHGLGGADAPTPVTVDDALRSDPGRRFDMVLTNPPFGKKSSVTVANAVGGGRATKPHDRSGRLLGHDLERAAQFPPAREDIAEDGRARRDRRAGQRPVRGRRGRDDQGVGCSTTTRSTTLLGLPTGIFYAQGVKANVLFFDRKPAAETP